MITVNRLRRALVPFAILALAALAPSCIEDGVSTSPSDQPAFSTDTLDMGQCFVGQATATRSFKVYNRHSKVMSISSIGLRTSDGDGVWRINVDGWAGQTFHNIEIRPNDSIFVMVEATVPLPADKGATTNTALAAIDFVTNGKTSSVQLRAEGRTVTVLRNFTVERDTVWRSEVPFQIFESLTVAEGATLTLEQGAELLFHDAAVFDVRGTLIADGTPEAPVTMTGDRVDNVVADIPFDLIAGQWEGLTFHPTSTANRLSHTVVKNTLGGVMADSCKRAATGEPGLRLINSRLRNSTTTAFLSWFADVEAVGTEFSDAASAPLLLCGGTFSGSHLTVANYYLFAPISDPLLTLAHYDADSMQPDAPDEPFLQADIDNTIFYGLGSDINVPDLAGTSVYVRRCLWKSTGTDDEHFINCVWGSDPLYHTVREDYIFDYTLEDDSPARGAADPSFIPSWAVPFLTADMLGTPYSTTIGAFQ